MGGEYGTVEGYHVGNSNIFIVFFSFFFLFSFIFLWVLCVLCGYTMGGHHTLILKVSVKSIYFCMI